MTKEEIKEAIPMKDILRRYGIEENRAGFIHCPFHEGDREASMRIYDKDFHCFGCGANGDIFDFVMKMEECSFPAAFKMLGGSYQGHRDSFSARLARYHLEQKKEARRRKLERERREKEYLILLISVYQKWMRRSAPLSEAWCDCYNALQKAIIKLDDLEERRGKY